MPNVYRWEANKKQANSYCRTPEMKSTSYLLKTGRQGKSLHILATASQPELPCSSLGKTQRSFSKDVQSDSWQLQVGLSTSTGNRTLCENLHSRLVSALVPLLLVSSQNAAGTRSLGRRLLRFFSVCFGGFFQPLKMMCRPYGIDGFWWEIHGHSNCFSFVSKVLLPLCRFQIFLSLLSRHLTMTGLAMDLFCPVWDSLLESEGLCLTIISSNNS